VWPVDVSASHTNGVPTNHVYQVDASRQSDRISANVGGFLGTIRVALNDNLLKRCSEGEIKAVMAHELGHYVLNHIIRLVIYKSLLTGVSFAFAAWLFVVLQGIFGGLWGVRNIGDVAGLPILLIGIALFNFVATPLSNTIIRQAEAEADIFGMNTAREPDAWAKVVLKLSTYRKLDPTPWEEIIFYDHPSGRTRIRMGMQWKSEHLNDLSAAEPASVPAAAATPAPAAGAPAETPAPAAPATEPAPTTEPVPQGPDPE